MASDVKEAIRRLIYQYVVEGADKVMATQEAVAASTTKTDKASLSLEKAFGGLERKYVDTVRAQQDYAKVQEKVNAAVAQNPALQERANVVLAAAGQHFDNLASRAEKGSITTKLLGGAIRTLIGPAGLLGIAMTGIGTAIGYMAAQWQSSSTTVEQALNETNRLLAEGKKLIDERTSAQDRMFAQSRAVTELQTTQNLLDLQLKLNKAMEDAARLAERRATTPTQVPGEMGDVPTGLAPLAAGYDKVADAVARLREAHAAGLPGLAAFNDELARIGQEYPEIAAEINKLIVANQQNGIATEQAVLKQRAMSDALAGVATNAQMAAAGLGSIAQFNFNNLHAAEAAAALERMSAAMLNLANLYPGITLDTAKQLELLEGQLNVAKARTDEERLIAQEKLKILQLTLQGVNADEASLLAAKERLIAEANIARQKEEALTRANEQRYAAEQQTAAAAAKAADNMENLKKPTEQVHDSLEEIPGYIYKAATWINDATRNSEGWLRVTDEILERWSHMKLTDMLGHQMSDLPSQFAGKQYTSTYDPLWTGMIKQGLLASGHSESDLVPTLGPLGDTVGWQVKAGPGLDAANALGKSLEDLTSSTDSLNATMQAALSPYYSQDPRTTKLGFRAGVVGNQDWLAPGASNANPLAAILGQGATAPGMASGGSFIVGGGYSANDNKIAAFPVASGEQVVVNRAGQDSGAKVVNIDNRIIVNGSVDTSTLSQMKVSRYQQSQRMRAGLAQA